MGKRNPGNLGTGNPRPNGSCSTGLIPLALESKAALLTQPRFRYQPAFPRMPVRAHKPRRPFFPQANLFLPPIQGTVSPPEKNFGRIVKDKFAYFPL